MSTEAADQVVNMSLKSLEVIAKLSGTGLKTLATFLYATIRSKDKSKGKGRLSSMLKSGKELKVFSIRATDLKTFKEYAKKYGVLYCVVKDRNNVDKMSDIIVRAEDAAKINRIIERFQFAEVQDKTQDKESPSSNENTNTNKDETTKDDFNDFVDSVLGKDKEPVPQQTTEQEVPSEPKSDSKTTKSSVRDDLFEIRKEASKKKETTEKQDITKEHTKTVNKNKQATKNKKVKTQGNTKTKNTKAR